MVFFFFNASWEVDWVTVFCLINRCVISILLSALFQTFKKFSKNSTIQFVETL
jgi:hypothetical protein